MSRKCCCALIWVVAQGRINQVHSREAKRVEPTGCVIRDLEDEGQNHSGRNRIHSNSTCGMRGPGWPGARRYLEELQLAVQY